MTTRYPSCPLSGLTNKSRLTPNELLLCNRDDKQNAMSNIQSTASIGMSTYSLIEIRMGFIFSAHSLKLQAFLLRATASTVHWGLLTQPPDREECEYSQNALRSKQLRCSWTAAGGSSENGMNYSKILTLIMSIANITFETSPESEETVHRSKLQPHRSVIFRSVSSWIRELTIFIIIWQLNRGKFLTTYNDQSTKRYICPFERSEPDPICIKIWSVQW